jgi:hypothetical protein
VYVLSAWWKRKGSRGTGSGRRGKGGGGKEKSIFDVVRNRLAVGGDGLRSEGDVCGRLGGFGFYTS